MIRDKKRNRKLGWALFLVYLALLVYFAIFAESFGRVSAERDYVYNLELFKEIRRFYHYRQQLGMKAFLLNVVGNVAAFIPCGFFLPIVSRRSRRWYNAVLLCFGLSLGVEVVQLVFKVGSFDVDDLLLNTGGGVIGYVSYRMIQRIRIRRKMHAKKTA
ncbi:MAG: VanZ family protein [Lachnospiraceae bacterium]|nr:VanZ family protein [Lachnospiraceae bacterium]